MLPGLAFMNVCMVPNVATVSSSSLPSGSLHVVMGVLQNECVVTVVLGELHITQHKATYRELEPVHSTIPQPQCGRLFNDGLSAACVI